MAIRKRSPQRARGRSTLERSFRDAQAVLSGYIESGGKQVKDTMTSLLHIFDMDKAGARTRSTRAPRRAAAKPRAAAAPKRKAPARRAASRSAAATRRSKRPATTKRRSARSAKRAPRI